MSIDNQIEREEEDIYEKCANGEITKEECHKEIALLYRNYREQLHQDAQEAYDKIMNG